MKPIIVKNGEPLSLLFVAINHYISTGDHIGEGIALEEGSQKVRVVVAVNTTLKDDREDFLKFKSKFDAIKLKFQTRLDDHGREGIFHTHSFAVAKKDIELMTQAFTEAPGALGWGSMKGLIEKNFPG